MIPSPTTILPLLTLNIIHVLVPLTKAKLVQHTFELDYGSQSPDGVKNVWTLKINKKFPGPTIEAELGDILQVDVINTIKDKQNTSIHWHGIHQQGTPFQDGPSMITQCPIKYGYTQRYVFQLKQWGTYWYHSHVRSQYSEGVWGALIIHPKKLPVYSYDHEMVITLNDWYHTRSSVNEGWYLAKKNLLGVTPFPDSFLLNGKGRYPCEKAMERNFTCKANQQRRHIFIVPAEKRIRLRLINTSSRTSFYFSIDSHTLETIEVDGIDAISTTADVVLIAPAQRYSFIINTNQKDQDIFLIRAKAELDPHPDPDTFQGRCINCTIPLVTAVLQYDRKTKKKSQVLRKTEIHEFSATVPPAPKIPRKPRILDESLLLPYDQISAPSYVDHRIILDSNIIETDRGYRFAFNHTLFSLPDDEPILHKVVKNISLPLTFPYINLRPFTVVQIIVNNFDGSHPFHMHGHHFWVVGKFPMRKDRNGNYLRYDNRLDGGKVNLSAVKRDTVFVPEHHVVVLMFYADNPGVWTFHCHIDWHNLGGMAFILNEAPELVRNTFRISEEMKLICRH